MGDFSKAAAKTLICGFLAFGVAITADAITKNSQAIAGPGGGGGGGGGPGGGGGGPGGGGPGGGGGNNGNDKGVGNGAAASAAGALNAARADATARGRAAETSRVGLIAKFEELAANLLSLQATYQALVDARDAKGAAATSAADIAAAEATLLAAGLIGPGQTLDDVDATQLDAAIDAAEYQVGVAMGEAATVQQALIDMLEPAGNKEVTPSVVNSVLSWLGMSK